MRSATVLTIFGVLTHAAVAGAQPVSLALNDGRVTLHARGVPVQQILREWARIGDVDVVNGDKIAGPSMTLDLTGVSEREALAAILDGVSGYVLVTRPAAAAGATAYSRIVVLPTSSTSPAAEAPRAPSPARTPQPRVAAARRGSQPPVARPASSVAQPADPQVGSPVSDYADAEIPPAPSAPFVQTIPATLPQPVVPANTAQPGQPSAPARSTPASPFAPRPPTPATTTPLSPPTTTPTTTLPPAASAPPPGASPFFDGAATARPGEVVPVKPALPANGPIYPEGYPEGTPPPRQ